MKFFLVSKKNKGFTLIELMVAISIFSVVMVMCMGSILSVLDANHKSATLRSVMDNLNYTLEGMTRSIRFGKNYHCGSSGDVTSPSDCSSGDSSLSIKDSNGSLVTYGLSSNRITRSIDGGANFYLTSPDVTIQSLTFYVLGSYPFGACNGVSTDCLQPRMVIVIKGYADSKNLAKSSFTLETTISQRKFDYQ